MLGVFTIACVVISGCAAVAKANGVTSVSTAEELHTALKNATNGTTVELAEGEYTGEFSSSQNALVIRGKGSGTILKLDVSGTTDEDKTALKLFGKDCQVQNLKLSSALNLNHTTGIALNGSDNILSEVELEGFSHAVILLESSSGNKLSNVSVKDSNVGIKVKGNLNNLTQIVIQNTSEYGLHFYGDYDTLESFLCDGCNGGIHVTGQNNSLTKVETRNSKFPEGPYGVFIGGSGHKLDSFRSKEDNLGLSSFSSNDEVRNVVCSSIFVRGGENHRMYDVEATKLLSIVGSGHRVEKYKAKEVKNKGKDVKLIKS